jgi:hypothetical protein
MDLFYKKIPALAVVIEARCLFFHGKQGLKYSINRFD